MPRNNPKTIRTKKAKAKAPTRPQAKAARDKQAAATGLHPKTKPAAPSSRKR